MFTRTAALGVGWGASSDKKWGAGVLLRGGIVAFCPPTEQEGGGRSRPPSADHVDKLTTDFLLWSEPQQAPVPHAVPALQWGGGGDSVFQNHQQLVTVSKNWCVINSKILDFRFSRFDEVTLTQFPEILREAQQSG